MLEAPSSALGFGGRVSAVSRIDGQLMAVVDVEQILAGIEGSAKEVSLHIQQQAEHQHLSLLRVMVVDDSVIARQRITGLFEQMQVECVVCQDGREALERLQSMLESGEQMVSLVVSDIEMPRMDGYALTRAIRETPALRKLKVLLHSSLSGVFNEALVRDVGADRFIAKFQPDLLAKTVMELMAPSTN
jgi:two-component system chemotaxis response regulator CheV